MRFELHATKKGHRYYWAWTPETSRQVKRETGLAAADPEQPLTWHDAARITQQMREMELHWQILIGAGWQPKESFFAKAKKWMRSIRSRLG